MASSPFKSGCSNSCHILHSNIMKFEYLEEKKFKNFFQELARGVGSLMVTVERAEGLSKEWMDSLERFWHPQISLILKMTMTTF